MTFNIIYPLIVFLLSFVAKDTMSTTLLAQPRAL